MASLDHAMWFHRSVRVDEWLFYDPESPITDRARGFARGAFYTVGGTLVASCSQEGMIRYRQAGGAGAQRAQAVRRAARQSRA